MQYLATVTALVSFFRYLGGIVGLTLMSSVVNNKVASALSSNPHSSSLASLSSIQNLPPPILKQVQDTFADAIRWAYIAVVPFVAISAISSLFLREVKIERSAKEETQIREDKSKDVEMGHDTREPDGAKQESAATGGTHRMHKPRVKVYGPIMAIIWVCQAIGDKMGWRK